MLKGLATTVSARVETIEHGDGALGCEETPPKLLGERPNWTKDKANSHQIFGMLVHSEWVPAT